MSDCPICKSVSTSSSPGGLDGEVVNCPRCGEYKITRNAAVNWQSSLLKTPMSDARRFIANSSGWIREHQNELIDSNGIERLLKLPTPSYDERKRKLLDFLQKQSTTLGLELQLDSAMLQRLLSACWCTDDNEISFLITSAAADALVELGAGLRLTAKGYDYLSQLNKNPDSQIGFCAMWFDDSVNRLWDNAIEPAMKNAGYEPLRIDKKDHANRIDDEIFADIRRSRFIVADFTHGDSGVRGGVYFEAGFAQGLGLPVIWTCREDMLSGNKLHFDIRQYNFLGWSENNLDAFKDRLQKRIEAILGRGTYSG